MNKLSWFPILFLVITFSTIATCNTCCSDCQQQCDSQQCVDTCQTKCCSQGTNCCSQQSSCCTQHSSCCSSCQQQCATPQCVSSCQNNCCSSQSNCCSSQSSCCSSQSSCCSSCQQQCSTQQCASSCQNNCCQSQRSCNCKDIETVPLKANSTASEHEYSGALNANVDSQNTINNNNLVNLTIDIDTHVVNNINNACGGGGGSGCNGSEKIVKVPVKVPVRVPIKVPVYISMPRPRPQPRCCVIVQPCVTHNCNPYHYSCSGCHGSYGYRPINPCYSGCSKRESWDRYSCSSSSDCGTSTVDCSECNDDFYLNYHDYSQCHGCFYNDEGY